jgi:hypothetical protein
MTSEVGNAMIPAIRSVGEAFEQAGRAFAEASAAWEGFGEQYFDGQPLDVEFDTYPEVRE